MLPYAWSLAVGQLPAGLALNAVTGVISGTPTAAGTSAFTVQVLDAGSPQRSAQRDLSIAIAAGLPGAFGKSAPSNGAWNRPTALTLSWGASSGATSYEYCVDTSVDTSNDNACAGSWLSTGTTRQAAISGLARSRTYYWQVRALNGAGATVANGGSWWRFTTR